MPIPYDLECAESMSYVYTAKDEIITALDRIIGLADDKTWSGPPADTWVAEMRGHVNAVKAALGEPLDQAARECRAHALKLKADSAHAAASATTPGG